jgi:hypothetical protein
MPIVFHGQNDFNLVLLSVFRCHLGFLYYYKTMFNDGLPLGVYFGVLSRIG